ncbi:hypothetical protein [Sedimentitalea nanhaiensis]|uniref:Uncharacterized protein n=1 Tax=Sedimentitalea nanhaiensis TaxID=999627 RepID=A0A1I7BHT5_9RHOB|nr:hypothetical protein [Sedimentitalea nanhaiensis]SFT86746.1 hypothetical protein SAMN05216236_11069 [Sedimentitalea nanhaiensis]
MRIRRLTLTLPAHLKDTAQHDARRIAEALAQEAYQTGACPPSIAIAGHGQTGAVLAQRVALAMPKGGRNGR